MVKIHGNSFRASEPHVPRQRQIRQDGGRPSPNPQVLEKLHETPKNTNVMQVTEAGGGFAARWQPRSGIKGRRKYHHYQANRVRPKRHSQRQIASMRLPDFSLRVKGLFVAVPQIEHNWTPHRPVPPQT
jgi:hypothetical protein